MYLLKALLESLGLELDDIVLLEGGTLRYDDVMSNVWSNRDKLRNNESFYIHDCLQYTNNSSNYN